MIAVINTKLYSVEDLVNMLPLTEVSIRKYLRENKLRGQKIGLKWFVMEENLKKFLKGDE